MAVYQRARAADEAVRDEAVRVIERWNAALAAGQGALWSPTIRCAVIAGTPWLASAQSPCVRVYRYGQQ
jgi:hypothetical protein